MRDSARCTPADRTERHALRRPRRTAACLATAALALATPPHVRAQAPSERSTSRESLSAVTPFTGREFSIGSPTAPHSLTIYLSVTCSHCAAFHTDTWPELRRSLVDSGRVRVAIRELPTAPVAAAAAGFLLARCNGEKSYWSTVERLLDHQAEVLQAPTLEVAIAREVRIAGLDAAQAELCLSDTAAIAAIDGRRQAALAAGIDSTPFFYVDGRPLRAGARLAGRRYEGGEIDLQQLVAAFSEADGAHKKGG